MSDILDAKEMANIIFDVFEHTHYDSWGKPTTAPISESATPISPPATVTLESSHGSPSG